MVASVGLCEERYLDSGRVQDRLGGTGDFMQTIEPAPIRKVKKLLGAKRAAPSALTQLLSRITSLPLSEVTGDLRVQPNHVYVIPPNTGLEIAQGILKLRPREDRGGGYLCVENKVDGAVLVLTDIDHFKQPARTSTEAREEAEAIIRTMPEPLIILDADLRIQMANDAFYLWFHTTAAETKGKLIFDVGHGSWRIPKLRETLAGIIPLKTVVNDFEIIHDFEKLGRRVLLLNAGVLNGGDLPPRVLVSVRDITEVAAYQAGLRRSELRHRRLFEASQDGVLILDPETRKIQDSNPFMTELLGYSATELRGKELFEIGLLQDQQANISAFEQLRKERYIRYEDLPLKTKNGQHRDVEFVSSLYAEDGREVIQCNIRDITGRKRAEEHRSLLMHELDHRVKNILTVVQSIARQTSINSTSQDNFIEIFEARLLALAKTNDVLIENEWKGAPLREIILTEISPYNRGGPQRVTIAGAKVKLDSLQASALGLAFHELATNAAKYGSLSVPNGRVAITWDIAGPAGGRVLRLRWIESGGPTVKKPDRSGFGSQLIAQSLENGFKADVQWEFLPEGIHFTLNLPLTEGDRRND